MIFDAESKIANRGARRRQQLGVSVIALASSLAVAAQAQAQAPAATNSDPSVSEVVVTGTRLARTDAASANPISIVPPEALTLTNTLTVDDILAKIPGVKSNAQTPGGTETGTSGIELRNLGVNRTLILVNGRRYTPTISLLGIAVNINTIPESTIDHIEILKDGASPIYGSDAVSGVVNIITKQSYEGLRLDAEGGLSSRADRAERHFSLTAGKNFERGNVLANFDYTKRDATYNGDRAFASRPVQDIQKNADGSFTPIYGGIFSPGGVTLGPDGTPVTINSPTSFAPLGTNLYEDSNADQTLASPLETYSGSLQGRFRINGQVEAFAEANYAHTSTILYGSGAEFFPGRSIKYPTAGTIPANNPYNIFGVALPLYREYTETGQRSTGTTGETTRALVGLRGDFAANYKWEVSYGYGLSNSRSNWTGQLNVPHLINSFDPVLCAQAPGCVVANPFGPGSISPAAAAYIRDDDVIANRYTQQVFAGSINGDLFTLPAGPLSGAAGYEVRRETGETTYSPLIVSGDSSLTNAQPTRGAFSADEVYAEINAPLLKDAPFAKSLSLDAATRFSHYSTFGEGTTWKVGLNWAITPDVRLRASTGTGFRAPAIDEFAGGALATFATYVDPCDSARGLRAQASVESACAAAGLSPTFRQLQTRTLGVREGNPDLQPEKARESGAGIIITPRFAPGLALEVDYYRIILARAIFQPDPTTILNNCYAGSSAAACQNFARGANGQINQILLQKQNIGLIKTDGLDVTGSYALKLADVAPGLVGAVSLSTTLNYVFDFEQQSAAIGGPSQYVGKFDLNGGFGSVSRFRTNTTLAYGLKPWRVAYTLRTISGATAFQANPANYPASYLSVPSVLYHDLAVTYEAKRYEVVLGVQNLGDRQPPFVFNGANYDSSAYDIIGRYVFGKVAVKF